MKANIINEIKKDSRVCPMPQQWNKLWKIIVDFKKGTVVSNYDLVPPLILSAWSSDDQEKRERLLEHIEYAAKHNKLEKVHRYLMRLEDKDWFKGL